MFVSDEKKKYIFGLYYQFLHSYLRFINLFLNLIFLKISIYCNIYLYILCVSRMKSVWSLDECILIYYKHADMYALCLRKYYVINSKLLLHDDKCICFYI